MSSRVAVSNQASTGERVAPLGKLLTAGLIAGVAAAVINTLLYLIGSSVLGIQFLAPTPPTNEIGPIPAPAFAFSSLIPALAAALLLWVLGRFTKRPLSIFQLVAGIFLLFSFFPIATMPAAIPGATRVMLGLMHIVAGASIIGALTTRGRG